MKKTLLGLICFLAYIISIQAQTLYGLTHNAGKDGAGALIKFTPATNNLTVARSFEIYAANPYYTNFIQANNGKLYGMTSAGGNGLYDGSGYGLIFSFDPSTSTYTMLKALDGTNGRNPYGSLVQASNGKLYGMTTGGGSDGYGVIFSFDLSTSTYSKLKDFDNINGGSPYGNLVQASDGKLYGMTSAGGSSAQGIIFSFDPSSSTFTKLKDFDGTYGANPYGSLIQAGNGKLYGMTSAGGSGDFGVIFSFDPSSGTYNKLKDYDDTNGSYPFGSLMQASNGMLYGMTAAGGNNFGYGVIFSFDPSSSIYTKLKDFDYTNGYSPSGSLLQANNGKLYGMTRGGGSSGAEGGVIFSFNPSTSDYTKLVDLDYTQGNMPSGSLMQANNGKLYGMTNKGGRTNFAIDGSYDQGSGVIFSFDPSSSIYTKLRNLVANNGGIPTGALLKASNGKLYGMTYDGGTNGLGVIFSFDPSTSIYTKLIDFDGTNGAYPYGSLIQASDGKLYGMTSYGGIESWGILFSFDPSTSTFTKLKDFFGTKVVTPFGSLIQASNGKLYGVSGDEYNTTIFSFDPSSSSYKDSTINHDPYYGSPLPYGNLLQASDGKLYGTYLSIGSGVGNLFSFDLSTSTYTRLKDFVYNSTDGYYPTGSLMQANDGKLYGMTSVGGSIGSPYAYGVIFSFHPSTSTYTKLNDFDGTNGANPIGSLIQASDGKLYGITNDGGSSDAGVVFSFDPSSSTYTKLKDFSDHNSFMYSYYYVGSAFIEVQEAVPLPVTLISFAGKNNGTINQLSWKVEKELDLNYYELQRSIDGQHFTGIVQIKAAGNNSYTYNDSIATTVTSTYYYRLKSVDKDGKYIYSPICSIRFNAANSNICISPNPVFNSTVISFSIDKTSKVSLKIFDLNGRLVSILANEAMQQGNHKVLWDGKNANGMLVSPGTYFLRMDAGDYSKTKRLFVVK